ncbi:DUF125-domain-containing protein [Hypoxylon fuscum]|nr:DUF125-domain-containing protein [Hypoxylon fuscum]
MQLSHIRAFFIRPDRQGQPKEESLPAYSTLATSPKDPIDTPISEETVNEDSSFLSCQMDHPRGTPQSRLSQFLSHFTLGFADGLTVPFALTAGLSSLGETRTVIYAGMAEICAGCISMGIGGYLAANGGTAAEPDARDRDEKLEAAEQDSAHIYLAPLDLPLDLFQAVRDHIDNHPTVLGRLLSTVNFETRDLTGGAKPFPAAVVGLSVAFGYLLGGLLPLFPYFFVGGVDDGLQWSFLVCILSLFIFGCAKECLLHHDSAEGSWQHGYERKESNMWERIKQGSFEGMRMVIMGGLAALAAVVCVRFFEGIVS